MCLLVAGVPPAGHQVVDGRFEQPRQLDLPLVGNRGFAGLPADDRPLGDGRVELEREREAGQAASFS
jgi:hypothetical protein